jgi:uncharacterized membrane protein YphA (DoxX/SURF4 family)
MSMGISALLSGSMRRRDGGDGVTSAPGAHRIAQEEVMNEKVRSVWSLLRVVFGVVPIVAGLDKFVGLLADWDAYLGPLARSLLPVAVPTFLKVVGVVEIVAGALVLSRLTRVGAYVVAAWLVAIALQLAASGHFLDVAVRDLVMAASAFALARLSEARERAAEPLRSPLPGAASATP